MARQLCVYLACVCFVICAPAMAQKGQGLSQSLINEIQRDFELDTHAKAMQNALTSTSIKDLSESREILAGHSDTFSHRIKTKGISNQKSSGRCWMFAGFNTLRPVIMKNLDLDTFEFSHIYLQFWDKFEKANTFLEYMIQYRDLDIQSREISFLMKSPCPDGGYWENFTDLVNKYGLMPKEAMAETASSESTGLMTKNLNRILRKHAGRMLDGYEKDQSVSRMRAKKKQALADVYKILVLNLGQPPREFTWRHTIKAEDSDDDEDTKEKPDEIDVAQPLSERQTFTPRSFYETFVNVDLSQYVNIADDPIRAKGTHSEVLITKNLFNGQNAHFANVSRATLKQVAVAMLLDNRALYFAADVSPDQDSKKGIMADGLYDFESVYGLDMSITKRQRLLYRDSTVNHGMAFIGVDLLNGIPQKWLVENSWGSDKGQSGLWTMYDNWFDEYVFNLVVHKKYVPQAVLDILEKPATKLPVWDPMW
jgi:bleomycin hydrolase